MYIYAYLYLDFFAHRYFHLVNMHAHSYGYVFNVFLRVLSNVT